ncbi:hypothetical protein BT63DRAFT_378367 [Microthyrium microscopicum]|uniref:Arrestin-like N-terminal domain-containing protein n=1 Tax=Microthyrium microscopicum TaxID=703497 RepID=A0A6A6TYV7_9PEZI|nr:hypothetical protein BT63DRAFT_378367 [Microthyrium microscopicum]
MLRRYYLGPRVGTLNSSLDEPNALVYPTSASTPSTETTLRLSLRATLPINRRMQMAIRIKSGIRVKTYYSAKPMHCMPNQSDLSSENLLQLHDDIVRLEEQRHGNLEWTPSLHEPQSWSTSLKIQINPSQVLLPSFCSVLLARSYSFLAKISVSGIHAKPMEFEMPLQVVYPFERTTSVHRTNSRTCEGAEGNLGRDEVRVLLLYRVQWLIF